MDNHHLWKSLFEAWRALTARFEPVVEQYRDRNGVSLRTWSLLLAVYKFEPEITTPAHFLVRSPYTSADVYMERLEQATGQGWLEQGVAGGYQLTSAGRTAMLAILNAVRDTMAELDPLSPQDSQRLAFYCNKLVHACLETPPPPDTWSIKLSQKLMPEASPPMPFIEQAFSCLEAYRDDAHLASWQASGLSAMGLETLTLLWRGEVSSLDEICIALAHRGHACKVYQSAIQELRERGLVTGDFTQLAVNGKGRVFRNQIDEDTDALFFAPWNCFDSKERAEFTGLVIKLREGLDS
jgi:hypothetical protein